jgi:predicted O-linked N-acetylglucosamine transferase (SPINDLY family)
LYKPTPVIITHLGNHGAVGMRQVDFKLTDARADLPDAHRYQIEAPLALDCCVLPFRRVAAAPEAPVTRADLGLDEAATVFGVFVSLLKLSPRCLGLWKRILDAVPDSVLAFSPTGQRSRHCIGGGWKASASRPSASYLFPGRSTMRSIARVIA